VHDVLGVGWVLAAAVGIMIPALAHGLSLGEYDWLSSFGLLVRHGVSIHNGFGGDQIDEMIPWTSLAWTQVHHGQLPLWNPYNALGMPLAFNWQSAVFSLPNLVGYLFPLRLMYTVQVLMTLCLAGTGAYVLGRVLRLSVLACALAGTVFELSGPFFVWLGWPIASVVAWTGWLFAAVILIIRGRHRIRDVAFFAVAFAFAVFAGEPDTLVLLVMALVVFAVVLLVLHARARGAHATLRPFGDLVAAGVAGICLGAPLLLPGLQLVSGSTRNTGGGAQNAQKALSVAYLYRTAFPWLIGSPLFHEYKYIGIIAVVLALGGVIFRHRVAEVVALAGVAVVMAVLAFTPQAISVVNGLPGLHAVRLPRALMFFTFAVAMLAGVGLHVFLRSPGQARVRRYLGAAFGAAAVILLVLWVAGPGHINSYLNPLRRTGFHWAVIGVATGLVAVGVEFAWAHRGSGLPTGGPRSGPAAFLRRHGTGVWTAGLLVVVETLFLISSGMGLWTSTATPFAPTSAALALKQAVGSSLVGLGTPACLFPPGLGIPVNDNIIFGVHQLAAYDPVLPQAYYDAWKEITGQVAGQPPFSHYCPGVTSAALAREYGVSYVIEPRGSLGPYGGVFDRYIGPDESLFRIPGASWANLVPLTTSGGLPPGPAAGVPVVVTHPDPASWKMSTRSSTPQVLRLHLTDVPGWHATIDGRTLPLQSFSVIMLQAKIPPGRHVIVVSYWPTTFTAGIVLFVGAAVALIAAPFVAAFRRRRERGRPAGVPAGAGATTGPPTALPATVAPPTT